MSIVKALLNAFTQFTCLNMFSILSVVCFQYQHIKTESTIFPYLVFFMDDGHIACLVAKVTTNHC